MSASLMPMGRQQFFTANGVPLAGGFIYSYAAGTSTPQACYSDASGATALPNPVVLDAGGFASIWLGPQNYKIVVEDSTGVTQWTVDNVSSVSLTQLQAAGSFSSLTVSGDANISGNETVGGTLTAATLNVTGSESVGGTLTVNTLNVTGNESVGGTLGVTGATSLGTLNAGATTVSSLNIGTQTLTAFVAAMLPSLYSLPGSLVVSNVTTTGGWVIFTLGSSAGTNTKIAIGAGTAAHGSAIPLPTGFVYSNSVFTVSTNHVDSTPGNALDTLDCSVNSLTGVVTMTGADHSGHSFNGVANWFGMSFLTNQ